MVQRPIVWKPGVGQQTDATRKISLNGHLLHIQKGHVFPAGSVACRRCWKAGIEVGGHGERDRDQLGWIQCVLLHQCIHQLGDSLADGMRAVVRAGGGTTQAPEQPGGRHGLCIQRGWPLSSSSVVSN